ncbi:MAG: hypothetical protein ACRC0L_11440 [Angustibacter sp.]
MSNGDELHGFVGAFHGSAAFRIAANDAVAYSLSDPKGTFQVAAQSRYEQVEEEKYLPREFWVEVRGPGVALEPFILQAHDMANTITSILTFASNCATDVGVQATLAFDACGTHTEHDYFQNLRNAESGLPRTTRLIDTAAMQALLRDLFTHRNKERLLRAIGQYEMALRHWHPGGEVLALAHLFIVMEVLTPIVKRGELNRCGGEAELMVEWGLEPKRCSKCGHQYAIGAILDAEVRRRLLFRGEDEVYKEAKRASDGFEHGFLSVPEVRVNAVKHIQRVAGLARRAIFDLVSTNPEWRTTLLHTDLDRPVGSAATAQYLKTTLRGDAEALQADGNVYPYFTIVNSIRDVENRVDGKTIQFTADSDVTAHIGEGVEVVGLGVEHWFALPVAIQAHDVGVSNDPGSPVDEVFD